MSLKRFHNEQAFFTWMLEGVTNEEELFQRILKVAEKIREGEDWLQPFLRSFLKHLSIYVKNTGDIDDFRDRIFKTIGFLGKEFLDKCVLVEGSIEYDKIRDFLKGSDLSGFLNTARGFYRLIEEQKKKGSPYQDIIENIPELVDRDFHIEKMNQSVDRHGVEKTILYIASFLKYSEIRSLAEELLDMLERERVVEVLIEFFIDTDDNILSQAIFQYLLGKADHVVPHIHRFINSKDMVLVVKGLRILMNAKPGICVSKLKELIKYPNPVVQVEALKVLMCIPDKQCIEIIKDTFFHLTGEAQIEALRFLKDRGEIKFIEEISRMPGLSMNEELFNLINETLKG